MTHFPSLPGNSLILILLIASGCGGGSRQLQSVSLSPASADAESFPNGKVPFVATGTFSKPPSPVQLTSNDVLWCVGELTNVANPTAGVCAGNIAPFATVDQNGTAQCGPTSQGTVYVLAGTPSSPAMGDQGQPLKIFGSAQLTCP